VAITARERTLTNSSLSKVLILVLAFSRSNGYSYRMARMKLSEQIRNAVNASGMSRYAIAKALGIAESTMSRFMNGKGGLSMDFIDRLAELLGMHIVVRPTKKQGGK
jgi:predicted XRE-type DNA-binding protein